MLLKKVFCFEIGFFSKANQFTNFYFIQIILTLCTVLGVGSSLPTLAENIRLEWDAPTTNEDGSPLTNLRDYKLYLGPTSASTQTVISNILSTSYNLTNLIPGTYFARVTAFNRAGLESNPSTELQFTVESVSSPTPSPSITPSPPTFGTAIPTIPPLEPTTIPTISPTRSPVATPISTNPGKNPGITLFGTVEDSSGQAISNVRVYAAAAETILNGISDEQGEFEISNLIEGKVYRIKAQHSSFIFSPEYIDVTVAEKLDINFIAERLEIPDSCKQINVTQILTQIDEKSLALRNIAVTIMEKFSKQGNKINSKSAQKAFLAIEATYLSLIIINQSMPEVFLNCVKTPDCKKMSMRSLSRASINRLNRMSEKLQFLIGRYRDLFPQQKTSAAAFFKSVRALHSKILLLQRRLPANTYMCT